jgi:RES domain-containing protein
MARFFRIVQERWAATAMDGEGARLFGGRWNPSGVPAVYLAESRALAALEILVHAPREAIRLDWRIIEVDVPDESIESSKSMKLPDDWQALPSSPGARFFGNRWLETGALALRLPSVVIPEESALLLNPRAPGAADLKISKPRAFGFDARF